MDSPMRRCQTISRRSLLKTAGGLAAFAIGAQLGLKPSAALGPGPDDATVPGGEMRVLKGTVLPEHRLHFKPLLAESGIEFAYKELPQAAAAYDGDWYRVVPDTIWWHWDGGPTPTEKQKNRVYGTYNALAGRTRRGDPVATHFSAGPGKVLQMLPLGPKRVVQGRLTDDRGIDEVLEAWSLGGIQLETTGRYYGRKESPTEIQTETLLALTLLLMRQYRIPFGQIIGHIERSPVVRKPDPGLRYLKSTRIRLLKALIKEREFELAGPPQSWDFYRLLIKKKEMVRLRTQTPEQILGALSPAEVRSLEGFFEPVGNPVAH
mgnify:CR=1 FL=1